ncbi:MAG: hypothetical protein ACRDPS_09655 [Nocardioides sp.]|uniref:hypothetical protein n=1 Tax=Nocardioides sp. TaxID=35761 RepID=UPI003D6B7D2D
MSTTQDKFARQMSRVLLAADHGGMSAHVEPMFKKVAADHRDNPAAVRFCARVMAGEGVMSYSAILTCKRMLNWPTLAVRLVDGEYVLAEEDAA